MAGALTSNYNLLPVHGSIWDFTARIGLCKSIHAANMAKNEQHLNNVLQTSFLQSRSTIE